MRTQNPVICSCQTGIDVCLIGTFTKIGKLAGNSPFCQTVLALTAVGGADERLIAQCLKDMRCGGRRGASSRLASATCEGPSLTLAYCYSLFAVGPPLALLPGPSSAAGPFARMRDSLRATLP